MSSLGADVPSGAAATSGTLLSRHLRDLVRRVETHPRLHLDFVNAMTRASALMAEICPDGELHHWSVCAGSGMSSVMMRVLIPYLAQNYNLKVKVVESVAAEKHPRKRSLYMRQHEPRVMVDLLETLSNSRVRNCAAAGSFTALPPAFSYDGGFPCTSRTGLSSKSGANANCVQDTLDGSRDDTATGNGYRDIESNLLIHWPELCFLENICKLFQKKKGTEMSDGEHITDRLNEIGFRAFNTQGDHRQFGAWSVRWRAYWIALLHVDPNDPAVEHFFNSLLMAMQVDAEFEASPLSFLTLDDNIRKQEAESLGLPQFRDTSGSAEPTDPKSYGWKMFHKRVCDLGTPAELEPLPFPYEATEAQKEYVCLGGLSTREKEALLILDRFFPPEAVYEFIDINADLGWTCKSIIKTDTEPWAWNTQVKSPWHACPATDAGSTKYCFRYSPDLCTRQVRVIEPHEEYRMQGWDLGDWRVPVFPPDEVVGRDHLNLLSDLAGNSFSLFHCTPVFVCALATWGRFADLDRDVGIHPPTPKPSSPSSSSASSP